LLARSSRAGVMGEFLLAATAVVVATVALGLVRVARGPGYADRMMGTQLLGSGSIAALLLVSAASGETAVVDVALTLALLAAFASIAFVHFAPGGAGKIAEGDDRA